MRSHVNRQFIRELEKAFTGRYPYLKMELPKNGSRWLTAEEEGIDAEKWQRQAQDILTNEINIADDLTVGDLESRLKDLLNTPVVVLRRSGSTWIATTMTRQWTLKQQNDHGRDLADGAK